MAGMWKNAFEAIRRESDFVPLNDLFFSGFSDEINVNLEWDGQLCTPLFIAVLLRLDDHMAQFIALGADPAVRCLHDGLLCGPLHAAALCGELTVLRSLLDAECDANLSGAETSELALVDDASTTDGRTGPVPELVGCNALHVLVSRDVFLEEIYRMLLSRGAKLSATCRTRNRIELSGLSLPRHLGNREATEERLDSVIYEEVKHTIRTSRMATALNNFLEWGYSFKRSNPDAAYRFARDIDFSFARSDGDGEETTALLYAADNRNSQAVRLLLYAGADASRTITKTFPFDAQRTFTLEAGPLQLAVLNADTELIDQLTSFDLDPSVKCEGFLRQSCSTDCDILQQWKSISLVHLVVLARTTQLLSLLLECKCDINAQASRFVLLDAHEDLPVEPISPLMLAVIREDIKCTWALLEAGAVVDDVVRAEALRSKALAEMFGGPPKVGLTDWVAALLTGEWDLQQLLDRRTDVNRALDWPQAKGSVRSLLEPYRLAGPELVGRLVGTLEEVPTVLRDVRPVHIACLFQQPWALEMLADAGVSVADTPPCREVPRDEAQLHENADLAFMPLDALCVCVRVGGLQMLERLCKDPRFALDVRLELALAPDITPPFYPRRHPAGDDLSLTWAWQRLGLLELALLHRRVDAAVLLVRLGVDLLHTVDHVAARPPAHYSITDMCFRGLTPLHLCALIDYRVCAAALLNEGCADNVAVVPDEHARPQRQALLSAICVQLWATVDTGGDASKEPWLWRDLTPLHLALIAKSYDVAELLIEASTSQSLEKLCYTQDAAGDVQSHSALLLAYNAGLKDLHRKIARKFPSC